MIKRGAGPEHTVMFHIGRSGSTVLADLLGQHPQLHWDNEVYLPIFLAWERGEGSIGDGNQIDPIQYLADRIDQADATRYGFEVKFFHLKLLGSSLANYLTCLPLLNVTRVIVLKRKNYLRKIVSSLVAHHTGVFHRLAQEQPSLTRIVLDVERVRIDFEEKPLLAFLHDYDRCFQKLMRLVVDYPHLNLTYEEDIAPDPRLGYRRVCEFLGIAPRQPKIRYRRTTPYKLSEVLSNFAEVEQVLADTPFAWMVYE